VELPAVEPTPALPEVRSLPDCEPAVAPAPDWPADALARSLPDCEPAVAPTAAPDCPADAEALIVFDPPAALEAVAEPQDRSTSVPLYVIVFI